VGTYKFKHDGQTESVDVILKGEKLYGRSNDEDAVELYPVAENKFWGTSEDIGGLKVQFVKNQNGDVTHFLLEFASQLTLMRIPFDKVD
jgi:hypothetical protein